MIKSNSRLRQQCSKLCNIVVGVLSLAPCYVRKKQVRDKGVPSSYHSKWWSVFVEWWLHHCSPLPCKSINNQKEEVLHLFRWYTHTHTSHIARFDFWKSVAGRIGTTPVKVNLSKANVHTGNHFIQKRNSEPVEGLRSHRGSSCVQP